MFKKLFAKSGGKQSKKAVLKIYGAKDHSPTAEETFSELQPPGGLQKFKNMADNEPIIAGLLTRINNVLKSADYIIEGKNEEMIKKQLYAMPYGIRGIVEDMTSAFVFGFSLGEKIYASAGREIVIVDVEPRYQPTISRFVSADGDSNVNQIYAEQQTASKGTVNIPLSKCLHFIPYTICRNPYGKSLLRGCYKPYYYKSSIEASEAQGIDRSLSGLPVMTAPEGFDFVNADEDSPGYDEYVAATLEWAENVVSKVRKDEMQGIVKPFGWELALLNGQQTTTVNSPEIISRLNVEMAVALLQTFAINGGFASTNNSNIEEMVTDFRASCDAWLLFMADLINKKLIKEICDLNMKREAPIIRFDSVSPEELEKLASYVARLIAQGAIDPTITMEKHLLRKIKVPYTEDDKKQLPQK